MDDEEPLALGADAYLSKLLERKSMLQKFMSAIKVLAIAVSLVNREVFWLFSSLTDHLVFKIHNSPIYDECETNSAMVFALPPEPAYQDNTNDTLQPVCDFKDRVPLN